LKNFASAEKPGQIVFSNELTDQYNFFLSCLYSLTDSNKVQYSSKELRLGD
jgi:hypothetical protein